MCGGAWQRAPTSTRAAAGARQRPVWGLGSGRGAGEQNGGEARACGEWCALARSDPHDCKSTHRSTPRPCSRPRPPPWRRTHGWAAPNRGFWPIGPGVWRSEARRGGKERRSRWSPSHSQNNTHPPTIPLPHPPPLPLQHPPPTVSPHSPTYPYYSPSIFCQYMPCTGTFLITDHDAAKGVGCWQNGAWHCLD